MPEITSGPLIIKNDKLIGAAGGLFVNSRIDAPSGDPDFIKDDSSVKLYANSGGYINLGGAGFVRIEAPADLSINANKNLFQDVAQDTISHVGNFFGKHIGGSCLIVLGDQDESHIKATKDLQLLAKTLQEQIVSAAKSVVDEDIPCPVCNQKVLKDEKSQIMCMTNSSLNELDKIGFYASDGLKQTIKMFTKLLAGLFSVKKNSQLSKDKKSCGSPGCVNNKVKSLRKTFEKLETESAKLLKEKEALIRNHHEQLGKDASVVVKSKNSISLLVGLAKNNQTVYFPKGKGSSATGHGPGNAGYGIATTSKGNCDRVIYVPPVQLTDASLFLEVAEKFTVNAGSPGIVMTTPGLMEVTAGGLNLRATDGEALLSSGNKTIIAGKMVEIIADDRTGDTGVVFKSKNVHFTRSASVDANFSVRGAVTAEGPVTCSLLNVPSMESTFSVHPSQFATGRQMGAGQAIAARTSNIAKEEVTRFILDWGYTLTYDGMMNQILEILDEIVTATTIDWIPGGFSWGWGVGLGNLNYPVFSTVYSTVWLYYHNHGMQVMEAGGSVTVPLAKYHMTTQGAFGASYIGGEIPAVAPVLGSENRPGPKGLPGPCGGGALFQKERNKQYDAPVDDPYAGNNYVIRDPKIGGGFTPTPVVDPNFSYWKYGVKATPNTDAPVKCD